MIIFMTNLPIIVWIICNVCKMSYSQQQSKTLRSLYNVVKPNKAANPQI